MSRLFGSKEKKEEFLTRQTAREEEMGDFAPEEARPIESPRRLPPLPPRREERQEEVKVIEREITLSLLNEKLNFIINKLEEAMR